MNIVDSSGWLEYFSDGRNASQFFEALKNLDNLIVPSISLYEVYKVLRREAGETIAQEGVLLMQRGTVVDLTPDLAISAANLSLEHKIPMADSIILATARAYQAILWTQDIDFKGMKDVRYIAKT